MVHAVARPVLQRVGPGARVSLVTSSTLRGAGIVAYVEELFRRLASHPRATAGGLVLEDDCCFMAGDKLEKSAGGRGPAAPQRGAPGLQREALAWRAQPCGKSTYEVSHRRLEDLGTFALDATGVAAMDRALQAFEAPRFPRTLDVLLWVVARDNDLTDVALYPTW